MVPNQAASFKFPVVLVAVIQSDVAIFKFQHGGNAETSRSSMSKDAMLASSGGSSGGQSYGVGIFGSRRYGPKEMVSCCWKRLLWAAKSSLVAG